MSKKAIKKSDIKQTADIDNQINIAVAESETWYNGYLKIYMLENKHVIAVIHGDERIFNIVFTALADRVGYKKMKKINQVHFQHFKTYVKIEKCGIKARSKKLSEKEKLARAKKAVDVRMAEKMQVEENKPLPENATRKQEMQVVYKGLTLIDSWLGKTREYTLELINETMSV